MTTLDAQGMVTPYKVNRPLSLEEEQLRLKIKGQPGRKPHYELSLIRLNSTYVECVDKWFAMRGATAMVGIVLMSGSAFGLYGAVPLFLGKLSAMGIVALLIFFCLLGLSIYVFLCDAFTYTHYPIRFNRKNRQVYVFRRDGTVLKSAWDELYWTIYGRGTSSMRDVFVVSHVLAGDRKTVKETFALSLVSVGEQGVERLKSHFEFFRLYMQEGPQQVLEAIKPTPLIMLPRLDLKREGWVFGWQRLTLHMNGRPLLMLLYQVFAFPESFVRWFVMRTSKIPRWPQWVEDECAIEPGDAWVREGEAAGVR